MEYEKWKRGTYLENVQSRYSISVYICALVSNYYDMRQVQKSIQNNYNLRDRRIRPTDTVRPF
jgi:hypothetical protein